ncbi:hypothetical protein Pcinc_022958 [Petrolisthes cinctipes]|uniref:Uncharacterized protein n=1 Tax=Petrolisthes cinctipes TaxID=88211 RepID=A0AAE1FDQ8_PETCI|nr:hypothetical protein Pcinc_022958 [Petrolisthes cinctipes]
MMMMKNGKGKKGNDSDREDGRTVGKRNNGIETGETNWREMERKQKCKESEIERKQKCKVNEMKGKHKFTEDNVCRLLECKREVIERERNSREEDRTKRKQRIELKKGDCSAGYKFKTGSCKSVASQVDGFSLSQFSGTWYVIQGSNVASRCYSITLSDVGGSYSLEVNKQIFSLRALGVLHNLHYQSQVFPSSSSPSTWLLRVPSHVYSDVGYQVVGTDYTTWAVLYSCTATLFGRLESGLVLSRTTTLPLQRLLLIRDTLQSVGVDLEDLSTVQQGDCNPKLGGGFFTLELAKDLSSVPLNEWTSLITNADTPALSPDGCYVQEGQVYIYFDVCPDGNPNVVYTPSLDGGEGEGDNGSDGSTSAEYYYYYYVDDDEDDDSRADKNVDKAKGKEEKRIVIATDEGNNVNNGNKSKKNDEQNKKNGQTKPGKKKKGKGKKKKRRRKKKKNMKKRRKARGKKGKTGKRRRKNRGKQTRKPLVANAIMVSAPLQRFLMAHNIGVRILPKRLRYKPVAALFPDDKERRRLRRYLRGGMKKWRAVEKFRRLRKAGRRGKMKVVKRSRKKMKEGSSVFTSGIRKKKKTPGKRRRKGKGKGKRRMIKRKRKLGKKKKGVKKGKRKRGKGKKKNGGKGKKTRRRRKKIKRKGKGKKDRKKGKKVRKKGNGKNNKKKEKKDRKKGKGRESRIKKKKLKKKVKTILKNVKKRKKARTKNINLFPKDDNNNKEAKKKNKNKKEKGEEKGVQEGKRKEKQEKRKKRIKRVKRRKNRVGRKGKRKRGDNKTKREKVKRKRRLRVKRKKAGRRKDKARKKRHKKESKDKGKPTITKEDKKEKKKEEDNKLTQQEKRKEERKEDRKEKRKEQRQEKKKKKNNNK